ncbi:sister chromatid cohesion protein DCC1-like [Ptychodera flava]|uniref:sister chromatid cohesion protein DCC1-like n=1 Tax=Ptychodera flava TaxID=63121 RepID=UPI00396A5AA1
MAGNLRTLEQVLKIATDAKLDPSDLAPVAQTLYFAGDLNPSRMKIMECDQSLLQYLQEGSTLTIRGDKSDTAVACTSDKTFELKAAETSNTLLLVPDCKTTKEFEDNSEPLSQKEVIGLAHEYFELRPCRPKLKRLKQLLEENRYDGPLYEDDDSHQGKKYTFTELLESVQASEGEIRDKLVKLQACNINGYWRLLSNDFDSSVLAQIIQLIDENSWTTDHVPTKETLDTLENLYPRNILQHCLDCYGDKKSMETDSGEEIVYSLSEDKVCRAFAEMLLKPAGKFNLSEFLESWQQSVPEGMKTTLYQLEGLALIDRTSRPEVIWHFPVIELPEEEVLRFDTLFQVRSKWTLDEIRPYIQDLVGGKSSVTALLQKYARSSTNKDGIKIYNAKRPART